MDVPPEQTSTGAETEFGIMDYVVFGLLLLVSALIGVYHACAGGKQKTQAEWLSGNQDLSWLPTSLSLLASFISAITLLGTPSELYSAGVMYLYLSACYFVVIPLTACVYMPVFRRVNSLSAFVYLRRRFGNFISLLSCIVYILQMTIYMGIVLYTPALALNAVTGVSLEGSIITVSIVCVFYTVIGGMKAIIWTDALQSMVMILGMIVIAIAGTYRIGGFQAVYELSLQGFHLDFQSISIDPRTRHGGLDLIIGGTFTWMSVYSSNQAQVQRYISVASKSDAQKAILLNLPGLVFLMFISGYCGILAYAKYALCDPIQSGSISKSDQILPFFVVDTFSDWPGFSGLFVSSIFSGSLSTISSGVNAMAAVVLTNILPDHMLSETRRAKFGKLMAIVFGVLSLGFALICKYLQAILQLALSLFGLLGGPLLGLFTLGMVSRKANNTGAIVGYIGSLFIEGIVYYGSQAVSYSSEKLILYDTNCTESAAYFSLDVKMSQLIENQHTFGTHTVASDSSEMGVLANSVFRLSYMWYGMLGFFSTMIIGYVTSLIVRLVSKEAAEEEVDEDLLFQFADIYPTEVPSKHSYDLPLEGRDLQFKA